MVMRLSVYIQNEYFDIVDELRYAVIDDVLGCYIEQFRYMINNSIMMIDDGKNIYQVEYGE